MLFYLAGIKWDGKKIDTGSLLILIFLCSILLSLLGGRHSMLVLSCFFVILSLFGVYIFSKALKDFELNRIYIFLLFSSYIVVLYAFIQYFGFDIFHWVTDWGKRPGSTFGNPNFFAGYIVVLIPLAVLNSIKGRCRAPWFILTILLGICLYLTKTRGAWVAFFCSSFLFAVLYFIFYKKRFVFPFICIIIIFVIFIGYPFIKERFDARDRSVMERFFKWYTAVEMVRDKPIFGVGANNLKVNFALYQMLARKRFGLKLKGTSESNVHNEYLQVLAEQGMFGFISFIVVILFHMWRLLMDLKLSGGDIGKIAYLCSLVAFSTFSLTNFPLRIIPTAVLTFFVLGLSNSKK